MFDFHYNDSLEEELIETLKSRLLFETSNFFSSLLNLTKISESKHDFEICGIINMTYFKDFAC